MKYLVDNEVVTEEEFMDQLEEAVTNEVENYIDDIIDEIHEPVYLFNVCFDASEIIRELDQPLYREIINDKIDSRLNDYKYNFEYENYENIDCTTFETVEEDDESEDDEDSDEDTNEEDS